MKNHLLRFWDCLSLQNRIRAFIISTAKAESQKNVLLIIFVLSFFLRGYKVQTNLEYQGNVWKMVDFEVS